MSEIVLDDYPVDRLPDDLRPSDRTLTSVRVTISTEPTRSETSPTDFGALIDRARLLPPIGDDPVQRIRALRDEHTV